MAQPLDLTPHEYQKKAAAWICEHPYSALFLDMGLGKTLSTLLALERLAPVLGRVLIVAPKAVAVHTWPAEIRKWGFDRRFTFALACGDASKHIGAYTPAMRKAALNQKADITIINVENLEWLAEVYGMRWPFDTVVIDELSGFKGRKAQRFKTIKWIRPRVQQMVGLTGTPAPNGLLGLWPQMYALDGGERLGKYFTHFRDRFFYVKDPYKDARFDTSWVPKPGAEDEIYGLLGDIVLSMRAKDYLDLPGSVYTDHEIELAPEELARYSYLEYERVLAFENQEVTADNAGVLAMKLLQLSSGAIYDDEKNVVAVHRAKLDALHEEVEAANGQPLMVAYWFKHSRDRILAEFPEAVVYTPDLEGAWNRGEIPLALAHPASVGHGLNPQYGGHLMVWFDLIWNLELYQQLNGRLDRQGQTTTVSVRHLVAKGTNDERVLRVLAGKATTQEALQEALTEAKRKAF